MGLQANIVFTCDKCQTTTSTVEVENSVPDQWLTVQGYANIQNGSSVAFMGYYCPTCIAENGTTTLIKTTADL